LPKNKGFEFTPVFFSYTSGEIGLYFVQSGVVMNHGIDYRHSIEIMRELIVESKNASGFHTGVITGGETRDWIFSNPTANLMKLPSTMIYKDGRMVGASLSDKATTHVADILNEGSSPKNYWVPAIKMAGGKIKDIFFFVDRKEGGGSVMDELGLSYYSAVPLDSYAWSYLLKMNVVDREIYESLRERSEDKKAWAYKVLRSEAGRNELGRLIKDPLTRKKGINILEKGYPELREELIDRLKGINLKILDLRFEKLSFK